MTERKSVPIATVEGVIDRLDRINRRLIAIVILLIVLLVASNTVWVIYENSFEDYVETVEQETDFGDNNYIGEDGVIINH